MFESEFDNSIDLNNDQWAITVGRLAFQPAKLEFSQHVFIILEGVENNERKIWFIDFIRNPKAPLSENQTITGIQGQGRVRIWPQPGNDENQNELAEYIKNYPEQPLAFSCKLRLMNISSTEQFFGKTWSIAQVEARNFITSVMEEKENPPNFHLSGDNNILVRSGSTNGHSCFSWAKKMLQNISDHPHIRIEKNRFEEWFGHLPLISFRPKESLFSRCLKGLR